MNEELASENHVELNTGPGLYKHAGFTLFDSIHCVPTSVVASIDEPSVIGLRIRLVNSKDEEKILDEIFPLELVIKMMSFMMSSATETLQIWKDRNLVGETLLLGRAEVIDALKQTSELAARCAQLVEATYVDDGPQLESASQEPSQ